ncbi:hypothetical protein BGX38DRAFT_1183645 [Terfezia claveryi]|nr:hypothetical protein BGX38DRAFT_1183645 [Terfezia claveryi]
MLWKLIWKLQSHPNEYGEVVKMEAVQIPPCPPPTYGLTTPEEVDVSSSAIALSSAQATTHQQCFIDLRAHPEYPKNDPALLPSGSDRIIILPAYSKLYERACYLNERYKNFIPGGEQGDQPPPRHLMFTGIPGIGKSYAQSVLLFNRLAEGKITALQPFWVARTGYYLFSDDGVKFVPSKSDEDFNMSKNKDIWVLCDDEPLMEFNSSWTRDWMVIWTTSPGRLEKTRWRKEQKPEIWAMAEWAWPQVVSLRYVRKFHLPISFTYFITSHFLLGTEQALEGPTVAQRSGS